ncbi:hypothetical protein [Pseudomonas sp. NPDC012596]|uniref:hypothetical protein n=1 Tax=Pseudomonas sp. NPDC012596 TaxID=3364419 RepID=UPI0036973053
MNNDLRAFAPSARRVEESLSVLSQLARVLEHSASLEGEPGRLGDYLEDGVIRAMRIVSDNAHQVFCQLAKDLEIPQ